MPCVTHSLGRSEPVQAAATSRSHRRQRPSPPHDLVSDLVALPAGLHPPSGLPWIPSGSHHHKHFRNCSYHRKHKPLCHIGSHRHHHPRRRRSLDPLDEPRSRPGHCQSSGSSGSGSALSWSPSSSSSSRRVVFRWSASSSKPILAKNFSSIARVSATDLKKKQRQSQSSSSSSSTSSIGCHPCDTSTTTTNLVVFDDRLISLLRDHPVSSQNCFDVDNRLNISSSSSSPVVFVATSQLLS